MSTASFIPGQILTAAALNDVINSKVDSTNAQITGGFLEGIDHVYITGTNVSTNPTTGAMTVAGGVGIGGDVNGGGKGTFAGDVSSGGNITGVKGTFSDNLTTQKKLLALNSTNLLSNSSGEFGNVGWSGSVFAAGIGAAGQGPIFMNGSLITTNQKDGSNITIGAGVALTVSAEILASGVVAGRAFVSIEAFNSSNASLGVIATATTPNGTNALASATGTTPGGTAYVTVWKGVDTSPNVPVGGLIFRRIKVETGNTASLYSQEASISALQGNSNGELRLSVASADVTLTADQFSNSIFVFTGALTGNRTVTVPATNKSFIVQNLTTGTFSLTIKAVGQTPSASVIQGKASSLFSDSTGVYATSSVAGMQFAAVFSYAISTTFSLTQLGAIVGMSGAATNATLPAANTYPAGSGVAIANNSTGVVNIALASGTDTSNLAMPYATQPNDILFMYSDGVSKWTLGWYSNKFTPTFDGAMKAAGVGLTAGGITFADGTVQTTATQGSAPTSTLYGVSKGNLSAGATSITTAGYASPFVTVYKNGLRLTLNEDYSLPGDGITITLLNYKVAPIDVFEVLTGFTYNPSTVYVPGSALYTPAFGATSIATSYTAGFVQLFRNGAKLVNGNDYTATDGATINFIGFTGDGVTQYEVFQFVPLTIANMVSQSNPVLLAPLTYADGYTQATGDPGFKNWFLNGNFHLWQRGLSIAAATGTNNMYTADRWAVYRSGWAGGYTTVLAQGISPPLSRGSYYGLQVARTSGDTSLASINVSTSYETQDVRQLLGRVMTVSMSVFVSGTLVGRPITLAAFYGTGTDGTLASGFTGTVNIASASVVGASTWQKISITFTLPSNATQLGIVASVVPNATAGASDAFIVAEAQHEFGPAATAMEKVPIGEVYRRCQRFYETGSFVIQAPAAGGPMLTNMRFMTPKRTTPTMALSNIAYASASLLNVNGIYSDSWGAQFTPSASGGYASATWTANAELQ